MQGKQIHAVNESPRLQHPPTVSENEARAVETLFQAFSWCSYPEVQDHVQGHAEHT